MNCHSAHRLLSAERDGALADDERATLEAHVAACGECRQMRTVLGVALDAWRANQARVKVPDAERAWQDIHREIRQTSLGKSGKSRALPRWTLAMGAAAAVTIAATILPRWSDNFVPATEPLLEMARADYVETANNSPSMVYVDDQSGWLVVWAVSDNENL